MPIQSIERLTDGQGEEIGIRLNGVGKDGFFEVLYADIPGNSWNQNRLDKFVERAQELIDVRTLRTDLPVDDPARLADPNAGGERPDWFWDGADIVHRKIILVSVTFNGTRILPTIVRVRPWL